MTELEFVQIWQEAQSPAEAKEKSGLTYKAVYARVCRLRAKGVPLKYFRPNIPINELIDAAKVALNQES